jgi:hypothetical protein
MIIAPCYQLWQSKTSYIPGQQGSMDGEQGERVLHMATPSQGSINSYEIFSQFGGRDVSKLMETLHTGI